MKQFLSGWLEDHQLDRAVWIGSLLALPSNILIDVFQEDRAVQSLQRVRLTCDS